ncbi:MAG: hypothetical protein DCC55_23600 [Chloroflexi bacterium]|nr:MAG: hypothetical protein DCC55_23600 [Chloroflexota bacterium]
MFDPLFVRKAVVLTLLAIILCFFFLRGNVASSQGKVDGPTSYTISGRVSHEFSTGPFSGVVLAINTGITVTTNSAGFFQFDDLPAGSYILAPVTTALGDSLISFPLSRTVELPPTAANQDFTAEIVASDAGVGGRVIHPNGQPVEGVTIHLSAIGTAVTDSDGRYFFFPVAPGEYTLWPDKAGYSFEPGQRTVRLPADNGSQDFVADGVHVVTLPLILR